MKYDQLFQSGVKAFKEGKYEEAINIYNEILNISPKDPTATHHLGLALYQLKKFQEAEASFKKAISLNPKYSLAYYNLALTYEKIGKINDAEKKYKESIKIDPNFAQAYYNLGCMQMLLNMLDDSINSFEKAIKLRSNYPEAHDNLKKAIHQKTTLLKIQEEKKNGNKIKVSLLKKLRSKFFGYELRLNSNPYITNRKVESDLIEKLYKVNLKKLDKIKGPNTKGPLYGNGVTTDFLFFENNRNILKNVENDLIDIMKQAVKSEIYVFESFLNIFKSGSGSIPHEHLNSFDIKNRLTKNKYSLCYYLSVGDQQCSEPGIFKMLDPKEEILPYNGMISIIPSKRKHFAVYNGQQDRVMIGINFYSLN